MSLFVSGCRNRCKNCFQPETWDFCYGLPFTSDTEKEIVEALAPAYISGLTVLGGEPLEPENQAALAPFIERIKTVYPGKTIWIYTGFTYERLFAPDCRAHTEYIGDILRCADVLVDGPFVEERKNLALRFRGSDNQRIIDLKASGKARKVVLKEN